MNKDPYSTFIGAKSVAFVWIGSVLGPVFIFIGLDDNYRIHLIVGIGFMLAVLFSIKQGVKALKNRITSDFIAFTVVPSVLFSSLAIYVYLANAKWFWN